MTAEVTVLNRQGVALAADSAVTMSRGESMRLFLLIIVVLMLPGCAAMSLAPPNRWVDNNTLYSDKLPRLEIRVNEPLSFQSTKESNELRASIAGTQHSGVKTSEFFFKEGSTTLKIKIESLPRSSSNSYMIPPDYSKHKDNVISKSKKMNGTRFATGIIADVYEGAPRIYKAYGRVVGDTTRYQIFYFENLEEEWENYDKSLFTESDRDILSAFNKRADKSFSIRDFSPQ